MREQIAQQPPLKRRASAAAYPDDMALTELEEIPDSYYQTRSPNSARRYTTTNGNQVIEQGNRRVVIHREPPGRPKRRSHWTLFVGIVFLIMIIGWVLLTLLSTWWQAQQDDWKYGVVRTYQTDQFVGQADSSDHPDHFIAVNTGGMISVVQMNLVNPKYDRVYAVTAVLSNSVPVTLSFQDVNHDGKIDMLVTIGEANPYTIVFLNNGTEFTH